MGQDPCDDVICNTPPSDQCQGENTLRTYESCSYHYADLHCPGGCSDDQCQSDTCGGVTCDNPPLSMCFNTQTLSSYESPGTCNSDGQCTYAVTYITCPGGCQDGACLDPTSATDTAVSGPTDTDSPTTCDVSGYHILTSTERGWMDKCRNPMNIQGAVFQYGDEDTEPTMATDFSDAIDGVAVEWADEAGENWEPHDTDEIDSLHFWVATREGHDTPFDFCISQINPLD